MNFCLIRANPKRRLISHVVPVMTQMFAKYEKNTAYPPIQILRETFTEEQLTDSVEFKGNSMQLILFYLWMIRFNKVAKRLTKIFLNMCQRLKLYKVPEYNTIAVWMYILTGYVGLEHYSYAKRLIKSCHSREMLVTMVYAIERLGDLVGNNFYHHYFYKGFYDEDMYDRVSDSYTRSLNFAKKLYAFIKKRYVNHGNVAERTREANMREQMFQTLPTMSKEDFRGLMNSFTLEPPTKASSRKRSLNSSKQTKLVLPPRTSILNRRSSFIGFDYMKAIPKFMSMWTEGQYDDLDLDINKIEHQEYLLTGGYESPSDYSTDEKLALYNFEKMAYPRYNIIYRKPMTRLDPRMELHSAYRKYIKGKKSIYHSRLYIRRIYKRGRKRTIPKLISPRYMSPNAKLENLVIERKRMPPPKMLGRPRHPCPPPRDKTIKIKKNLATIFREASSILKEEEKQQQKLLQLMQGAPNYFDYEIMMEKRRIEDEKRCREKKVEARLKAQITYQAAILEKQRLLTNTKKKRKEFDEERKLHANELIRNVKRDQRNKMRLRRRVLRNRKRLIEKQALVMRKKNLEASALAWESYTMSCSVYQQFRKEFKRKKMAIRTRHLLKKVARIQKREMKPMKDIEWEERKKFENKWKIEELGYKEEQIKQTRAFNAGIKKFAAKYVIIKRRKKLLRKFRASGRRASILCGLRSLNTPPSDPAVIAIEHGNSIMDSFERQLEEFSDLKTLAIMRNKTTSIRSITTRLNKCLTRLTGVRLQKELTALEKANVSVAFIIELEKAKQTCEWYPYPPLRRTSSMRSSKNSFPKMYSFYSYGEDYEGYESIISNDWDLIEMQERRFEEKQVLLEEQALYICQIIKAIQVFFRDFVTPPLKKKTPKKDNDSNIRRLQQRLNRIKSEIFYTRQNLKYAKSPSFSVDPTQKISLHSFNYYAKKKFCETPVLDKELKRIKFIKLKDEIKPVICDQKVTRSDRSQSLDEKSEISLASNELLAEIKELSKKKRFSIRRKQKIFAGTAAACEVNLTTEEEAFLKSQPPGYKLYTNQWGNPVYELKVKNEFRYIWEWVPIAVPKSAEKTKYPSLTTAPYSLDKESVDSNDSAVITSTKEHNEKYYHIDVFDTPFIEDKWKKKQIEFSHLPKEVRKRYLNCVQRYVWEYYRNHPKGGRPEKILVHIPLGEIEEEYLYFINKQKTKTGKRLKEKLHDIEKQLGIYADKHKGRKRRRM